MVPFVGDLNLYCPGPISATLAFYLVFQNVWLWL